jgi:TolB-like protein
MTYAHRAPDLPGQLSQSPRRAPGIAEWPAVAILGFENMSSDREQDDFCGGVTEEILTILSKVKWLAVITRDWSLTYKGGSVRIQKIAEKLGVRYVVEGSVRRNGPRVRVTARLTDATRRKTMWAEHYDRDLTDLSVLQEITAAVAAAIEGELYVAETFRAGS